MSTCRQKEKLISFKSGNITFAEGLGYGLGYSFKYLGKEEQEKIVNNLTFTEDSSFIHGTVVGLGNAYQYLPEYLQKELFARPEQNSKFAKAFGLGFALWIQKWAQWSALNCTPMDM